MTLFLNFTISNKHNIETWWYSRYSHQAGRNAPGVLDLWAIGTLGWFIRKVMRKGLTLAWRSKLDVFCCKCPIGKSSEKLGSPWIAVELPQFSMWQPCGNLVSSRFSNMQLADDVAVAMASLVLAIAGASGFPLTCPPPDPACVAEVGSSNWKLRAQVDKGLSQRTYELLTIHDWIPKEAGAFWEHNRCEKMGNTETNSMAGFLDQLTVRTCKTC